MCMIILSLLTVCAIFCLFAIFRNEYVYLTMNKAINIISRYIVEETPEGRDLKNFYNIMLVSYNKFYYSFWQWNIKYCFKDEYRKMLEKYYK